MADIVANADSRPTAQPGSANWLSGFASHKLWVRLLGIFVSGVPAVRQRRGRAAATSLPGKLRRTASAGILRQHWNSGGNL